MVTVELVSPLVILQPLRGRGGFQILNGKSIDHIPVVGKHASFSGISSSCLVKSPTWRFMMESMAHATDVDRQF